MKLHFISILALVFFASCNDKFIEASQITIKINDVMVADSWIEIDGTVLYHFSNDTSSVQAKEAKGPELLVPPTLISENPNYVYLPASAIYNWSEGSNTWILTTISNAEMAANYVSSINEWQVNQTQSFDMLDRIFLFPKNQFELFKGEVTLKRADNQPMKIRKSPNYNGEIIIVE